MSEVQAQKISIAVGSRMMVQRSRSKMLFKKMVGDVRIHYSKQKATQPFGPKFQKLLGCEYVGSKYLGKAHLFNSALDFLCVT